MKMMKPALSTATLVLALCTAANAASAPSVRANAGEAHNTTAGTSFSVSLTGAALTGDAVVIAIRTNNTTGTCASSDFSAIPSGFTFQKAQSNGSSTSCLYIYSANTGQTATSFAFTSATSLKYEMLVVEMSGQNSTTLWDQQAVSSAATSTAVTMPSVTPTQNYELCLGFVSAGPTTATWTVGSGTPGTFTLAKQSLAVGVLAVDYYAETTATSCNDAGTLGSTATQSLGSFTMFSANPSSTPHGLLTTGAG